MFLLRQGHRYTTKVLLCCQCEGLCPDVMQHPHTAQGLHLWLHFHLSLYFYVTRLMGLCAGMWERSMDEMMEKLLFKNEESGYTYVAEFSRWAPAQPSVLRQCWACPSPSLTCLNHESLKRRQAKSLAVATMIVM